MTEAEIIEYVSGLPGVVTVSASEENAAPAAAWGDTFFFYDPDGSTAENQRLPFATLVIHDYAGWDTESHLDRDGIFRVNIAIGRSGFEPFWATRRQSMPPITTSSTTWRPTYSSRIRSTRPKAGSRSSTRRSRPACSCENCSTTRIAWLRADT